MDLEEKLVADIRNHFRGTSQAKLDEILSFIKNQSAIFSEYRDEEFLDNAIAEKFESFDTEVVRGFCDRTVEISEIGELEIGDGLIIIKSNEIVLKMGDSFFHPRYLMFSNGTYQDKYLWSYAIKYLEDLKKSFPTFKIINFTKKDCNV